MGGKRRRENNRMLRKTYNFKEKARLLKQIIEMDKKGYRASEIALKLLIPYGTVTNWRFQLRLEKEKGISKGKML